MVGICVRIPFYLIKLYISFSFEYWFKVYTFKFKNKLDLSVLSPDPFRCYAFEPMQEGEMNVCLL